MNILNINLVEIVDLSFIYLFSCLSAVEYFKIYFVIEDAI
jgi:hypothetical protein